MSDEWSLPAPKKRSGKLLTDSFNNYFKNSGMQLYVHAGCFWKDSILNTNAGVKCLGSKDSFELT